MDLQSDESRRRNSVTSPSASPSTEDLPINNDDEINSPKEEPLIPPLHHHLTSTIIGTHPDEVITSTNVDNGYPVRQENGQRKTGPPPDWPTTRLPPSRGCEVFVGKLPRDCFESELFPLFERCGQIYEMRLMMDFSGFNRGYAFITYTNRDDAKRCVKELNNYEIRKGRLIGVCQSVDNCRLFVGGIPKTKKKEEILDEMCKVTEGVVDVIVYPSAHDKSKNRGFAFVEYESHRSAAMARRKLLPGKIQLWGHQIAVDWAEPEAEVDEDIMATVRVLYVRNLMMSTMEEQIKEAFERLKPNSIERVKKLKDYAFVHFKERDDALHAMNVMNGCELDGSIVEVTLAKPVDKNQYFRYTRGVSPSNLTTNLPFGLPTGVLGPTPTAFDLTPHFTAIPYLTIPTTSLTGNPTPMQTIQSPVTNGTTVLSAAVNALQQKNVRRCINATGRMTSNGDNTSPPLLNRHTPSTPTSVLSSSSRPTQPPPTIAHHRGAYYTILRPASRRTDMQFAPAAFGFPPGTHLFQPATLMPHPLLAAHPAAGSPFHQQSVVFATTNGTGQPQQFYHSQPQPNFAFPFFFAPPMGPIPPMSAQMQTAPPTPTNSSPDSPLFTYATSASTVSPATTVGTANGVYSA